MVNLEIRNEANAHGVRLWQIAEALGVTDGTFSRWLRRELPEERKAEIMGIIEKLAEGGGER